MERCKMRRRKKSFGAHFRDHYTPSSYQVAIYRACREADRKAHELNPNIPANEPIVQPWHVHQLRHNGASSIASKFGLEAARVVCGHRTIRSTERYAHPDEEKAVSVMAMVG
jgi:integrase